ncbi:MAG: zinc ribbon domain-containing protein, partial [bacterium]
MPIFEFTCTNCAHQFELLQRSKSVSTATCPECKSDQVKWPLAVI